ncbi:MAG TPA: glycosyltransferase family 4 protein [Solirubrobacteraceae bacterium]|nr:glycosyltransferase family 4 protein [Solirubrobacteraceae bacterium]
MLFFNEGNLGSHILGQSQLEAALRVGLSGTGGIDARFESLEPLGRWGHTVVTGVVPGLSSRGLDQRALRFHLVESLRARRRLERELRGGAPDVLHLHTQSIALLARSIMRRLPVVLSVDATVRDWSSMPAWRAERGAAHQIGASVALERRALRAAALVIAWTEWARRGVVAEQPQAEVIAHHPGLDLQRYAPAAREPRTRPRVLFVGGRFKEKGGEDLLAALQGLAGRELDLDLVTPAQVPEAEGVTVHRLESAAPELLRLYQQADVLALPTHGDTNPWVLLEAMACGTPAVSTDVGAIPELLDDGRAGVIVPHGEPRALREALIALLADEQRREQLGRAGRERCEQRYDARRQFPLLADRLRALTAGDS